MSRKRYTPEQIIGMFREAEVSLSQGQTIGQVCRALGVSEQSYYRWRKEYGGLKIDQAKRFKAQEKENGRLRRAVSDLTLDKFILKEALEGNWQASPAAGSVLIIFNPSLASRNVMPVMLSGSIARHNGSHRVRDRMKMN